MKAATIRNARTAVTYAISIHAAREGGDQRAHDFVKLRLISIHAAREGGDLAFCNIGRGQEISIHAAREGGDGVGELGKERLYHFNPRRP